MAAVFADRLLDVAIAPKEELMTNPAEIRTFLWFNDGLEEALNFYKETFKEVKVYEENRMDGVLFTADFEIFGHRFIGMNTPGGPTFNDSISISVQCDGQDETDRLWDAITREGQAGRCGWCKDKWGLSWQITPFQMRDYLAGNPENWQILRDMTKIVLSDFV